jgi:hypothetical protein
VIRWLELSEESIATLVKKRRIRPFYKKKGAKAWYRKWEFKKVFRLKGTHRRNSAEPKTELLRLADIAEWLDIPKKEIASWASPGLRHLRYKQEGPESKRYYFKTGVKRIIVGNNDQIRQLSGR